MKKSEASIRTLSLKEVRYRFRQLRRDIFFDSYVTAVKNNQLGNPQGCRQVVYINQNARNEYSFPEISFRER
jgi:hypothetical protein